MPSLDQGGGSDIRRPMEVLRQRRVLLVRQIDELEEQARHNAIVPGD